MRVLLDTHAFLWWVGDRAAQLSPRAVEVIEDAASEVFVSAVTGMEIASKAARGRLELPAPAESYVPDRMARHRFQPLAVELPHALRAGSLPDVHRDPWDRLLIAQAQLESMPIVTADPLVGQYDVDVIW